MIVQITRRQVEPNVCILPTQRIVLANLIFLSKIFPRFPDRTTVSYPLCWGKSSFHFVDSDMFTRSFMSLESVGSLLRISHALSLTLLFEHEKLEEMIKISLLRNRRANSRSFSVLQTLTSYAVTCWLRSSVGFSRARRCIETSDRIFLSSRNVSRSYSCTCVCMCVCVCVCVCCGETLR